MRVLDTATILAAMAQVSPRARRGVGGDAPVTPPSSTARARSCHRPPSTPAERGERGEREPGEHEEGPRRSTLVVVPQGVIPVIVVSRRLAAASLRA